MNDLIGCGEKGTRKLAGTIPFVFSRLTVVLKAAWRALENAQSWQIKIRRPD